MIKPKGCSMEELSQNEAEHMMQAATCSLEEVSHAAFSSCRRLPATTTRNTRTEDKIHAAGYDLQHGAIKFTIFAYSNNLFSRSTIKLACYICLHQLISYKEAAALLNISKAAIAQLLQKSSKLFSFKVVSLSGWGSGGREKRIKLSKGLAKRRKLYRQLLEGL